MSGFQGAPSWHVSHKIDLIGATDVSGVAGLPAGALPPGIVPAGKSLFINMLDAVYDRPSTASASRPVLSPGPGEAGSQVIEFRASLKAADARYPGVRFVTPLVGRVR